MIIIKCILKSPLNPSTKLAPLTTNKKHKVKKIFKNNLFSSKFCKKIKSIWLNESENKLTPSESTNIISVSLVFGERLYLISSIKPIENKPNPINM